MMDDRHFYCMARVVLEAQSAHGIHSGMGDATHDVLLVRDANGLPTLPGTSIAGVLRHALNNQHGEMTASRVFGSASGLLEQASWLNVSWGNVHDSNNQPCEGLLSDDQLNDELLHILRDEKPLVRQRVALDHRGTAKDTGKFDVTLIPAGVRYTFVLGYWCDNSEQSQQDWQDLLTILSTQNLQLGHGTRNGYGDFKVLSLEHARWDLATQEGRQAYCNRPRNRSNNTGLHPMVLKPEQSMYVELTLEAESGWRIGGGEHSLSKHDKEPQLVPQHEPKVSWANNNGSMSNHLHLLPGSAIKGALRHRVAYHYRCLKQEFATAESDFATDNNQAVMCLFGFADSTASHAGLLRFHDIQLSNSQTSVLMHNRIDRFTGGVMNSALFSEEVLWKTPLTLRISVTRPDLFNAIEADIREALQRTLDDLANGWLPLGAGGSRGLGVFTTPNNQAPQWSDSQAQQTQSQEATA